MSEPFKPIKAPKRTPRKPLPDNDWAPTETQIDAAISIISKALRGRRWDDQGGYPGLNNGRWSFVSTSLGQFTPKELDALFAFAGINPDEIEVIGECTDCANSNNGYERGYSAPCVSCLRPSHINGFVPRERLSKRIALTAGTITDEQIRQLGGPGCERRIRQICKIALNDAPTYMRAEVVRNARARCAEILNERNGAKP